VATAGAGCINQGNVMMSDGHVNFRHPVFIAFGDQDRLTRYSFSRQCWVEHEPWLTYTRRPGRVEPLQSLPACKEWFEKIPSTDKMLKIYQGFYHERMDLPDIVSLRFFVAINTVWSHIGWIVTGQCTTSRKRPRSSRPTSTGSSSMPRLAASEP